MKGNLDTSGDMHQVNEQKVVPVKNVVKKWQIIPQPVPAWTAILGLISIILLCLTLGLPRLLIPIFPLGSLAIGYYLYRRYPILYVGFTWWMWFLGPFVRRLIDYRCNTITPWPYNLAPVLVTSVSIITVIRYLPQNYKKDGFPFLLCFISIMYAFVVGLVRQPTSDYAKEIMILLNWLSPIAFGFHLLINWRNYPNYRQNIEKVFLWGVLIMGIYGVVQFLVAPAWDVFFMVVGEADAVGTPEPLGIRVWSTMRTARPFAMNYMPGLILLLISKSKLRFAAAGFGYLTFLLTKARTGWYAWFISLILFVASLKERQQIKIIVTISLLVIIIIPLATLDPFANVISSRLETFSDLENDTSFNNRLEHFDSTIDYALSEFTGWGLIGSEGIFTGDELGASSDSTSDNASSNDNGYLVLLVSLGVVAIIPYVSGLLLILLNLFSISAVPLDPFAIVARSVAFASVVRVVTSNISIGEFAMPIWGFFGIAIAARKYYLCQERSPKTTVELTVSPP